MIQSIKIFIASVYRLFQVLGGQKFSRGILYYHGIPDAEKDLFIRQIKLVARFCTIVPLREILTVPFEDKPIVAITFDDAFANLLNNAIPFLLENKYPATIFIPTENLGDRPGWDINPDHPDKTQLIMTLDQIRQLGHMGFAIGSHTLTHPHLTRLSDEDLKRQLMESKQQLEKWMDREVDAISYPHGDYNDRVLEMARQAGYARGYTVEPRCVRTNDDPMAIPRFAVTPGDSLFKLKLILVGAWETDYYLRRIKLFITRFLRLK